MDKDNHVCPVWVGYLLASPVRRLLQNPEKVLGPYVKEGMTAMDFGCAMGFFSLPMAKLVGKEGKVICVDIQERMFTRLEKRAEKAGLYTRIKPLVLHPDMREMDDLKEQVDFALAFYVIHEVPDQAAVLAGLHNTLRPGGILLVAEPKGHVSKQAFQDTLDLARKAGLSVTARPAVRRSHTAVLKKV